MGLGIRLCSRAVCVNIGWVVGQDSQELIKTNFRAETQRKDVEEVLPVFLCGLCVRQT